MALKQSIGHMITFSVSFLASALLILIFIRYQQTHLKLTMDGDLVGVQKFHTVPVPRIGGVGVFLGTIIGLLINHKLIPNLPTFAFMLIAVALPTFAIGLLEDITKKIGVSHRLLVTAVSALAGIYFLDTRLVRLDCVLDFILGMYWFSIVFTCFAVAGVANAFNLIDGFNGLVSGVSTIILFGLLYVSRQLGDQQITVICLSMLGAIFGFALWNYPRGLIFMGDGGAYFIGFMIAELCILLVQRHPQVSPWFPLMLVLYPVFETVFTIFRRAVIKKVRIGSPDASHLHQLIYRRIIKTRSVNQNMHEVQVSQNSATSPYLWIMTFLSVIPAVLFYEKTWVLQLSVLCYIFFYIYIYKGMLRRRVPRWLLIHIR